MTRERFILHLNVADFAVAVERVMDRSLCGKPVIVAPLGSARAVVHDMSDEAYSDGVRKGMALRQAVRYCRSARILPPRLDIYGRAMSAFVSEAREYTPVLEYGAEDGHLFLDVTGTHRLFGSPPDLGWRLRRQVSARIGIDPIWSLGSNKLIAKVGSRLVKPTGEYIVGQGEEEAFLAPVPIVLLPGIRPDEMMRLHEFNIRRTGHLAGLGREQLCSVFGSRGDVLHDISRGIDVEPVRLREQKNTVWREYVFTEDSAEKQTIEGVIVALAVRVGMELRRRRLTCRRLALQLDYTDGSRVIRQAAGTRGVSDDRSLQEMACLALRRAWKRRTRIRGCRLCCDRLYRSSPQLNLFTCRQETVVAQRSLHDALDTIRNRFGVDALRFGGQAALH